MRNTLWMLLGALLLAVTAPAARADQFTYSFTGACYFAGTSLSFTTDGPAAMGTNYTPTSATDLYDAGTDYSTCPPPVPVSDLGSIESVYFAPSAVDFCGGTSPCTIELFIVATGGTSGPTLNGLTIPGPGTYTEYFGNGTLTVTEAASGVPEPSSLAFLLLGSGLFALRKLTSIVPG